MSDPRWVAPAPVRWGSEQDLDDDPVGSAVAVTTSMVGLVRAFAAVLALSTLTALPATAGAVAALALAPAIAAVLIRAADRVTATPGRRLLLLVGDTAAGAVVLVTSGFGMPYVGQAAGTAALAAALYGVPGVAVGAALGMVVTALAVLSPASGGLPAGLLVTLPSGFALAALVAALVRHLQQDQVLLRRSLRWATWSEAQTQERLRLARDLHDSLAKTLAGIALYARAVQRDPGRGPVLAAEIAVAAEEATAQARSMISGLRETASGGLPGAIRDLAARCRTAVRLELGMVPEPAPAVRAELVAVLSEALANVERHAGANEVTVTLSEACGRLRLSVVDDGRGFTVRDPTGTGRYGLLGMVERLHGIGGALVVRSRPGAGTTVVAELPSTPWARRPAAP
jgi:signal transduction histidine kinase